MRLPCPDPMYVDKDCDNRLICSLPKNIPKDIKRLDEEYDIKTDYPKEKFPKILITIFRLG
jgi:hypothetical protein